MVNEISPTFNRFLTRKVALSRLIIMGEPRGMVDGSWLMADEGRRTQMAQIGWLSEL